MAVEGRIMSGRPVCAQREGEEEYGSMYGRPVWDVSTGAGQEGGPGGGGTVRRDKWSAGGCRTVHTCETDKGVNHETDQESPSG